MKEIISRWVVEKGRWDEAGRRFSDRTEETFSRVLQMSKEQRNGKQVLVFHGGPTGHESYYTEDLLLAAPHRSGQDFCICGGTINSWPACFVSADEVFQFLAEDAQ